jgi:hypothetical protein
MPFRGVVPANKFAPSPYGLFSVADVTKHGTGDEHWAGGFDVDSEICNVEGAVIDVCGGDPLVFLDPSDQEYPKVMPFGIRARTSCLSTAHRAIDWKSRVMRQLEMITESAVEAELWAGTYAQDAANTNMYLSSSDAVDVTSGSADGTGGTAVKPSVGIALLEQALATCGPGMQGVLHMPASVGATLIGPNDEPLSDADPLHTINGNLIAVGNGYDGRGPGETEAPADWFTPWIYATGPVFVDLGPGELVTPEWGSAVDPKTNEMNFIAVRPASVYWDGCCHFAVQVDIRE